MYCIVRGLLLFVNNKTIELRVASEDKIRAVTSLLSFDNLFIVYFWIGFRVLGLISSTSLRVLMNIILTGRCVCLLCFAQHFERVFCELFRDQFGTVFSEYVARMIVFSCQMMITRTYIYGAFVYDRVWSTHANTYAQYYLKIISLLRGSDSKNVCLLYSRAFILFQSGGAAVYQYTNAGCGYTIILQSILFLHAKWSFS